MPEKKHNYSYLSKPFFVLAPMDDVTDTVFRQIIASCAEPDLFFTEFVNVDGLQSPGRSQLLKKIKFSKKETPIIAQIWGKDPHNFEKTARELVDMGFSGIDINMGCPVKTVVKNGCCSALMNNRDLALEIIQATKAGAESRVPISVKTRLGFEKEDMSWPRFLLEQGLDMLTIHGRTVKQLSTPPCNWEAINEVRQMRDQISPETLIVGNGDVETLKQGQDLAELYKLDGIMIGRGIFKDPFLFSNSSPWEGFSINQRIELFTSHIKLFDGTWGKSGRPVNTLNKFCKLYIEGFSGAKELREKCMTTKTTGELLTVLQSALLQ